jgi:hypothetical protein
MERLSSVNEKGPARVRRLLFDTLGVANAAAIVVSDAAQFPDAGTGFKIYTGVLLLPVTYVGNYANIEEVRAFRA